MEDIILTGPKHSGKTSAGRILASLFECEFFDIDDLIFQNTGKSPRQLYIENPESFKKAEAEALAALFRQCSCRRVMAAGGGVIDNTDAMSKITSSDAVTVCLNVSVETAWQRIFSSKETPPFPLGSGESYRTLHERRSAAYRQFANIIIEAENKTPKEIACEIFYKLSF